MLLSHGVRGRPMPVRPGSLTRRQDPPLGLSQQAAAVAIAEVLELIGDTCPECKSSDEA